MGDQNTILIGGGVGVAFSIASYVFVRVIYPLLTVANHKRIRSVCCGRTCVSSLDVEETTPTPHADPGLTTVQVVPTTRSLFPQLQLRSSADVLSSHRSQTTGKTDVGKNVAVLDSRGAAEGLGVGS